MNDFMFEGEEMHVKPTVIKVSNMKTGSNKKVKIDKLKVP